MQQFKPIIQPFCNFVRIIGVQTKVLDNYHAGKLEVLSENVNTGQIIVKDPSVTGIWRSKTNVNGEVVPISKESNIFVIKGGTKKGSKGDGVSVFPKNPDKFK